MAYGTGTPSCKTPKGSHYASLGFAAFVAKRRKSLGLDLRW